VRRGGSLFKTKIAPLQTQTLIETKNRTLKCLNWHHSTTVRSMKNVTVLMADRVFALFFRPHPGEFDSSKVPAPGNLPSKAKKNANLWLLRYYTFADTLPGKSEALQPS